MNDREHARIPNAWLGPFEAILWDLDGTLVDSAAATVQALTRALRSLGHAADGIDAHTFVGPRLVDSLQHRGLTALEIDAVRERYRREFLNTGLHELRLFEKVSQVLSDLRRRGIAQAIVSNRLQDVLSQIVEHVGLRTVVAVSIGREGITETKHDVVVAALRHLMIEPSPRVIVIGDRKEDLIVGRELGLTTIGAEWGYGVRSELESNADFLVSSLHSLERLLSPGPAADSI